MKILAIETSCDDTAIAIVTDKNNNFLVEKMIAYSQIDDHQKYGGVVPEIASRLHAEKITSLLAQLSEKEIKACDAIAVTTAPWLPGSLLVWKTTAKFLSAYFDKPQIPVYHIYGHIFSILLERSLKDFPFPRIVLTASGGHNDIYLVENTFSLTKIGYTLDDAAGECFDKVSRMLGGPYPGGVRISEKANKGKERDDIHFKRIFLSADTYEFSFSGMKSQVHYLLEKRKKENKIRDEQTICDIAYAFQEAIVEVLAKKCIRAAIQYNAKTIGIVGGVSANKRLREYTKQLQEKKIPNTILTKPAKIAYCTDNAAMIALPALLELWSKK